MFIQKKIVGQHKVVIGLVGETADLDPLQLKKSAPSLNKSCG
jgi:3-deoxy-7-phosphoheptulonate synthase